MSLARAARALRRKGPAEFLRLCVYNLQLLARGRLSRHSYVHDRSFDRKHDVDTAGIAEVDEIGAPEELLAGAGHYEATPPECFEFLLSEASVENPGEYAFVDVGSGKGRVLILAALAGFRDVVGVELGRELHDIACANLQRVAVTGVSARSINEDATRYDFPAEPTVCFLNNPFDAEVLARVIDNIEASLARQPREFILIYYHSNYSGVLDERSAWRATAAGWWQDKSHHYKIYRAAMPGTGGS